MADSVLQEAEDIVNGCRASDYGDALQSFTRIAVVSSVFCKKPLTASDVCKVLMAVKVVRESYKHKRDNLVDLCGYSELLQRIEDSTMDELAEAVSMDDE